MISGTIPTTPIMIIPPPANSEGIAGDWPRSAHQRLVAPHLGIMPTTKPLATERNGALSPLVTPRTAVASMSRNPPGAVKSP